MWEIAGIIIEKFQALDLAIMLTIVGMIILIIKTPKSQMKETVLGLIFIFIFGISLIVLRVIFTYFPPG